MFVRALQRLSAAGRVNLAIVVVFWLVMLNRALEASTRFAGLVASRNAVLAARDEPVDERLAPGWMWAGSVQDQSDHQWWAFKKELGTLVLLLAVFLAGGRAMRSAGASLHARLAYSLLFAVGFSAHAFGSGGLWVWLLAALNYAAARALAGTRHYPVLLWLVNLAILIRINAIARYDPIQLCPEAVCTQTVHDLLSGSVDWSVYYKLVFLRLISFGMDLHWKRCETAPAATAGRPPLFRAQETPLDADAYTAPFFFAYLFYIPLFIAGPVVTFNAFVAQFATPRQVTTAGAAARMAARIVAVILLLEFWTHCFYQYMMNEDRWYFDDGTGMLGVDVFFLGLLTVTFMYMKFLTIWRFFRLAACIDGIDSTVNLKACVHNTDSFAMFWRIWHASFANWIQRYLYRPLGGPSTRTMTIWPIFLFVGTWHEPSPGWMAWALMNALGMSVETVVTAKFGKSPFWMAAPVYEISQAVASILRLSAQLAIMNAFSTTGLMLRIMLLSDPISMPLVLLYFGAITSFLRAFAAERADARKAEREAALQLAGSDRAAP